MSERWVLSGKVTCDLCLNEQDLPPGTGKVEGRATAYLRGWAVAEGIDLCELCAGVDPGRVHAVCGGTADVELREELNRARLYGDWDSVRILAPALRGGPRDEADRTVARRHAREWAASACTDALVAAVPQHATDRHRSLAAWIELARGFCRAKSRREAPPVTAEWLIAAVRGTPHEESIGVIRALREIRNYDEV